MNHHESHPSWPAPETRGAVRSSHRGERRPTLSVPIPVDLNPAWVSAPPAVSESSEWPVVAVRRRGINPPSPRMVFGSLLVFVGLGTASFGAIYASVHANDGHAAEEPYLVEIGPSPLAVPPPAQSALAVPSIPVEPSVTAVAAPAPKIVPAPPAVSAPSNAAPTPIAKRAHAKARTVVHIEPTPSYPRSALDEAPTPAPAADDNSPPTMLDPAAPETLGTTPTTASRPSELAVRAAPGAPAATAPVPSASALRDNSLPAPADDALPAKPGW